MPVEEKNKTKAASTKATSTRKVKKRFGRAKKKKKIHPWAGAIHEFMINGKLIPSIRPTVPSEEIAPRVLMRVEADLTELYANVSREVMDKFGVKKAICHNPQWICAKSKYGRKHFNHGMEHRDVKEKEFGYLTCIILCDNVDSGGIRFWRKSHGYIPGMDFLDIQQRPKDLNRRLMRQQYEVDIVLPKKDKAIIFDSRLVHQSMVHLGEIQRTALGFIIATNRVVKLNEETELVDGVYDDPPIG